MPKSSQIIGDLLQDQPLLLEKVAIMLQNHITVLTRDERVAAIGG